MLQHWVWFTQLNKVTASQKQKLLAIFRDPEELFSCPEKSLANLEWMTEPALKALLKRDLTQVKQILEDCRLKEIHVIAMPDAAYPKRLRDTAGAPFVLYIKGKIPAWDAQPAIGIVGTRKASGYGLDMAAQFGKEIAACGALVVSGGAAGIDTMALEGALQAGRPTVAVLGGGVDVVYPKSNEDLFARIVEQGCLLSEYPPQTRTVAWHFPARNRIISGISNGVLVVEAPEKSGAMLTARMALDQGREVFVVPGNVGVEICAGSNALLEENGKAVLSGWNVVREYADLWPETVHRAAVQFHRPPERKAAAEQKNSPVTRKKPIDKEDKSTYSVLNNEQTALTDPEQAVFARIGTDPVSLDELIEQVQLPSGTVKSLLTKLMIKRLIVNLPGGCVARK